MTLETKTGLQALALTAGIALICGGGVFLFRGCGNESGGNAGKNSTANGSGTKPPEGSKTSNPPPTSERDNWTAQDMLAFLKKEGVIVEQVDSETNSTTGQVTVFATEPKKRYWKDQMSLTTGDAVHISHHKTADEAKTASGQSFRHIAWGRFSIECSDTAFPKVKKALGIK